MNAQPVPAEATDGPAAARSGRPATGTSAAEIIATARHWHEAQVRRCALAHGDSWPDHREWVEDYLTELVLQRLLARGWRPAHHAVA